MPQTALRDFATTLLTLKKRLKFQRTREKFSLSSHYESTYKRCELQLLKFNKETGELTTQKPQSIEVLPLLVLESILQKAILSAHSKETLINTGNQVYQRFAGVNENWRLILNSAYFTSKLKRQLPEPYNIRIRGGGEIKTDGLIAAVTTLQNTVYIALQQSNSIFVYDSDTPMLQQTIAVVKGRFGVEDMTSCSKNSCLYLYDRLSQSVWRIFVVQQDKVKEIDKYKVEKLLKAAWNEPHYYTGTLSTTTNGDLLLVAENPGRIDIYCENAQIKHSILLPRWISNPRHVITSKTQADTLILSYGWWEEKQQNHGICTVLVNWSFAKSYGIVCREENQSINRSNGFSTAHHNKASEALQGNNLLKLNRPMHMSVDRVGRIFLADSLNDRIVIFNGKLNRCKLMLTAEENGIHYPQRLCHDGNDRLYVMQGSTLKIYRTIESKC